MIGGVYGRDVVKKPEVLVDASEPSGRPESDHFWAETLLDDDGSESRRRTSVLCKLAFRDLHGNEGCTHKSSGLAEVGVALRNAVVANGRTGLVVSSPGPHLLTTPKNSHGQTG